MIWFNSCGSSHPDARLEAVKGIVDESPELVRRKLDSINPRSLSVKDRHLHDLLKIKANDKCMVLHTSDSVILRLVEYYSSHRNEANYPEVLYYAGRVYCDMGDYPQSIDYFHKALDMLEETPENIHLRGMIISQYAWILQELRLYRQAIPYFREAIKLDSIEGNAYYTTIDYQFLGGTYLDIKEFDSAQFYFNRALISSENLSESKRSELKAHLAHALLENGNLSAALNQIRGVPEKCDSAFKSYPTAIAARIYYRSGYFDTAYMYARQLISDPADNNLKTGYSLMFSPGIMEKLPYDSLSAYALRYRNVMENFIDRHAKDQSLIQVSNFNYQQHVRAKEKAEHSRKLLWYVVMCLITALSVLSAVLIYMRYRYKNKILQMKYSLKNVQLLNTGKTAETLVNRTYSTPCEQQATSSIDMYSAERTADTENERPEKSDNVDEPAPEGLPIDNEDRNMIPIVSSNSKDELRKKLLDEILKFIDSGMAANISPVILQSEAYAEMQKMIACKKVITENSKLWGKLESLVISVSPNFHYHLQLLTGEPIKPRYLHICLLIKCHVSPSDMAILLGKSKGTLSSHRGSLCRKIFGVNLGAKTFDDLIKSL